MRISDWSSDVCSSDLSPAVGILSITRHPFLWGTGLWALSHLPANGDLGSIVMMGGIAILSFGGMQHIDQRRESHLGASWGQMKLTTSVVPFAAALAGRTKVEDRKRGVEGKSEEGRVDIGGRRVIKKKKICKI